MKVEHGLMFYLYTQVVFHVNDSESTSGCRIKSTVDGVYNIYLDIVGNFHLQKHASMPTYVVAGGNNQTFSKLCSGIPKPSTRDLT